MGCATCHPNEEHYARGLCRICYNRHHYFLVRKKTRPEKEEDFWSFNCSDLDLYWLAGILEGEGCFTFHNKLGQNYPLVTLKLNMTDEDIVQRVRDIVNYGVVRSMAETKNRKPIYEWRIHGERAIKVMWRLYPIMGKRRKYRIKEVINKFKTERLKYKMSRGWYGIETMKETWEKSLG